MQEISPDTPVDTIELGILSPFQEASVQGEGLVRQSLDQILTRFQESFVVTLEAISLSNTITQTETVEPYIYDIYLAYLTFQCPTLPTYGGYGQLYPWIGVVPGKDGKSPVLRKGTTHIQWSYEGEASWTDLVSLSDISGTDGTNAKQVEIRSDQGFVQWRREGEEWNNIVSLESISGSDGRDVELRSTSTHIQWRYAGGTWADLVDLSSLKGEDGVATALSPLAYDSTSRTISLGPITEPRISVAPVSNVYTLNISQGNEFFASSAISAATTVNLSELESLAANRTWRGVFSFTYSTGTITWFSGNTGFVVKWDGDSAITPTAGEVETVVITVNGGTSTIEVAAMRGRA